MAGIAPSYLRIATKSPSTICTLKGREIQLGSSAGCRHQFVVLHGNFDKHGFLEVWRDSRVPDTHIVLQDLRSDIDLVFLIIGGLARPDWDLWGAGGRPGRSAGR